MPRRPSWFSLHVVAFLPVLGFLAPAIVAGVEVEKPDDPPASYSARANPLARSKGARVTLGSYTSVQINVDGMGQNIVGDAANEPTIAVNPVNPQSMVAGWRQFDTIATNFRQAGWAYTFNGGGSWTFPGSIDAGNFRSDPVLDVDSNGVFYYQSLGDQLIVSVFRSTDGGVTWQTPAVAWGGDKNWMVIDRTGGASDGFIYGIWQRFAGCCDLDVLTRSVDGGEIFQYPVPVSLWPTFGTLAVGPSGELYATGIDGTTTQDFSQFVVAKSLNARNAFRTPTFTGTLVDLGGSMSYGVAPNPGGLLGQGNVAVDRSGGATDGYVYVLASVAPSAGTDPLDVSFIRSTDGGATWSTPARVNDDPVGSGHWHWMAAHSVAPNGRIDVIWNDTRNGATTNISQLFYAYSWDAGATWSPNVAVSPAFDASLGYPAQFKMGDYDSIVSGETGADVAYTATFNGEQDVYYVRVFPDCNGNGISDVSDIAFGSSPDTDGNHIPDECQGSGCVGAGMVPDGNGSLPLRVSTLPNGDLSLLWGPSCRTTDTDYAVYEGTLGDFASHVPKVCSTGGLRTQELTPGAGDTYYLVVPTQAGREGSYGKSSAGIERPQGPAACLPRAICSCGS